MACVVHFHPSASDILWDKEALMDQAMQCHYQLAYRGYLSNAMSLSII